MERAAFGRVLYVVKKQKGTDMNLPDIEKVAAKVHDAWIQGKLSKGITSRKAEDGEELMVPYEQLSEPQKAMDRNTVKAVYLAIQECGNAEA